MITISVIMYFELAGDVRKGSFCVRRQQTRISMSDQGLRCLFTSKIINYLDSVNK